MAPLPKLVMCSTFGEGELISVIKCLKQRSQSIGPSMGIFALLTKKMDYLTYTQTAPLTFILPVLLHPEEDMQMLLNPTYT